MFTTTRVRILSVALTLGSALFAPRSAFAAPRPEGCPITVWNDASNETQAYCEENGYWCSRVWNCGDNGNGGYAYNWACESC